MTRAMPTISSNVTLPLCLTGRSRNRFNMAAQQEVPSSPTGSHLLFLTFFLSRGGSFSALMISAEAEGTTSI